MFPADGESCWAMELVDIGGAGSGDLVLTIAFEDDAPSSLVCSLTGGAACSAVGAFRAAGSSEPAVAVASSDLVDGAAPARDRVSREPMTEDTTSAKTSIRTLRSPWPVARSASARFLRADGNSAILRSPAGDAEEESMSARVNTSDALPPGGDAT